MQSCLGEYLVNWKIFRDKKGNFYSSVFFIRDKIVKDSRPDCCEIEETGCGEI